MDDRYKGDTWRKFKLSLKAGFTYGLALEIMFIGTGYMLYREYRTNSSFQQRMDEEFPALTDYYKTISGWYMSVTPKQLRDKILDVDGTDSLQVENATNPTTLTAPSTPSTAAQSNSTSKK